MPVAILGAGVDGLRCSARVPLLKWFPEHAWPLVSLCVSEALGDVEWRLSGVAV